MASNVQVYTSITCGFPLNTPSHPWPMIFVSNINCPQRLNTLKYFSSVISIVIGRSLSLCPSPLGDQAFGTSMAGLHGGGANLNTIRKVSTTGQLPSGGVIVIVYSVSVL